MLTFILWCILFVLCWPLALFALILYPIVWLFLLPFRCWESLWEVCSSWLQQSSCCRRACCAARATPSA